MITYGHLFVTFHRRRVTFPGMVDYPTQFSTPKEEDPLFDGHAAASATLLVDAILDGTDLSFLVDEATIDITTFGIGATNGRSSRSPDIRLHRNFGVA